MKAVLTLLLFICCLPFNSATAQSTVSQFRSLDDVFDFVRPSKTFSTRGGDLEIRCVGRGEGESMLMYYRNKFLSEVGWENPNTAAKGSYARLAVRTDRYQVTVILHLPDGKHSKPYLYFEPLPTSTNRQLATALNRGARINMPISNGWLKFDPIVDGDYATLSFQPSSSEPTPYYYDMKEVLSDFNAVEAKAFLEVFYKGLLDEDNETDEYVMKFITPNAKRILIDAYDYDCNTGVCLGTWILCRTGDVGPCLSRTIEPRGANRFLVNIEYRSETYSVLLALKKVDGTYKIDDIKKQ